MSKAKQGGSGSSGAEPDPTAKQRASQVHGAHSVNEQKAAVLINLGRLQEAEAIYSELIAEGTKSPTVFNNLGILLRRRGELAAAIASYKKAIELNPDHPNSYYNMGKALKEQGNLVAAIASYKKAIELNPVYPDAHYNMGNALKEQGDLPGAINAFNKAIKCKPDYPEAYVNLGNALREHGDLDAAIASHEKALELSPKMPQAHYNMGITLGEQGKLALAIASYRNTLKLRPGYPEAHNNLGNALREQGDLAAAIASYCKALEINPSYLEALWNCSLAKLLAGDYQGGWRNFDTRFLLAIRLDASPKCPPLKTQKLTNNETLFLITEQGLGDTLQFMRYVTYVRRQGVRASLCAPEKLHGLIKASRVDANPLTLEEANAVTEGCHLPLMSLPRVLGVTPEAPLITEPYIQTKSLLAEKWQGLISGEQRPVVGINWQGNPKHEKRNLSHRSLPLEAFAPIAQQGNISLLSLQKGYGSEQLKACSFKDCFVSCQPQVDETWDFLETAAIISNCDLIITSDTSVAHLAGGMGKPTWLLLQKVPDWRWGLEGDTTFWYPSMRLFRQKERGNWNEVMERVVVALLEQCPGISAA